MFSVVKRKKIFRQLLKIVVQEHNLFYVSQHNLFRFSGMWLYFELQPMAHFLQATAGRGALFTF